MLSSLFLIPRSAAISFMFPFMERSRVGHGPTNYLPGPPLNVGIYRLSN